MNKHIIKKNNFFKRNPILILMVIWILTSSQQCTKTDACGSYNFDPVFLKIMPTLNTNIPSGFVRPVVQTINGLDNVINVQGSILYVHNTIFGIKVESYASCNGVSRFKSTCCITRNEGGCLTISGETPYQITATIPSTLKCKVTIRAITNVGAGFDGVGSFSLYEGTLDVDPVSGTPPSNTLCNLTFRRSYSGWQDVATQYCLFNQ